MKKIIALPGALATLAGLTLSATPAQATTWTSPPDRSFRVIEANIGDGAECVPTGLDCLTVLNQRIAAYSPDVVAITEICEHTYQEFQADHPTWDVYYAVNTYHKGPPTGTGTDPTRHCNMDPSTGIYESKGLVLAGPDLGTRYEYDLLPDTYNPDPYVTNAKHHPLLCAVVSAGTTGPTRACVTHLVAGEDNEADRIRELRTIQNLKDGRVSGVSDTPWGRPYLAGDFNANDNDGYWAKFLDDTMLYSDIAPNAAPDNNAGPGTYRLTDPQTVNYVDHNLFRVRAGMTTSARSFDQSVGGVEYSTHKLQEAWVKY